MKLLQLLVISLSLVIASCGNGDSKNQLNVQEFAAKLKELPSAPILDVRTPGEFAAGHLQGAVNVDWNGSSFDTQTAAYDKSKPVFVYCLSGARSASAAKHLRQQGFSQVIEMVGGMMKWRAANLPETTSTKAKKPGMTKADFQALVLSDAKHYVLVDFYADWCAPCKKMKPYLDEIARDMSSTVKVLRINADEHSQLCKDLGVDALPVLMVYQNNAITWKNVGFVEKNDVLKHLHN